MNTPLRTSVNIHEDGARLVSDGEVCAQLRESCMLSAGSCMLRQADVTIIEPETLPGNSIVEEDCPRPNCGLFRASMTGGLKDLVEVQRELRRDHGNPRT